MDYSVDLSRQSNVCVTGRLQQFPYSLSTPPCLPGHHWLWLVMYIDSWQPTIYGRSGVEQRNCALFSGLMGQPSIGRSLFSTRRCRTVDQLLFDLDRIKRCPREHRPNRHWISLNTLTPTLEYNICLLRLALCHLTINRPTIRPLPDPN